MICHIWNGYIIWIISYAACDMLKLISSSWNYVGYEHGCSEHLEIFFLQQVDQQTFGPYKIYSFGELHHFYSLLFQYYTVQYEHNIPLLKQSVRPILTSLVKPTVHFIYFRTLTFEVVDIYTLWGLFPPLGQRIHVCQSVSSVEWNKSCYLDWSVGICIFFPILNKKRFNKVYLPLKSEVKSLTRSAIGTYGLNWGNKYKLYISI